jgi:hypothetical protein
VPDTKTHELWVVNAVDVPVEIQEQVMRLLSGYDPDSYVRSCDKNGMTS